MADELVINDVLRDYTTAAPDWSLAELSAFFHTWAARLSAALALDVPTPCIVLKCQRSRQPGSYKQGRNSLGLYYEITFNLKYQDLPQAAQVASLCRELLRQWQGVRGTPGAPHYFNGQFRNQAQSFGLHFDRKGNLCRVEPGPFTRLLEEHRIDWHVLSQTTRASPPRAGKFQKWCCDCGSVWATRAIDHCCNQCGKTLVRMESGAGRPLQRNSKKGVGKASPC